MACVPMVDMPHSLSGKKIWVAGHRGLVGEALCRVLTAKNDVTLLTVSKSDLDLTRQAETEIWLNEYKPDVVVIAAARVGGIKANSDFPAEFLFENLAIAQNIIHASYKAGVRKLLFLGSSCIYPKYAEQPIQPHALLTGALEPTNEAYAIAKIAGIKLCQYYRQQYGCDFISVMPCNLYGQQDRWDAVNGHVIPALMHKFYMAHENKIDYVDVWGSGRALREFLHADDLARGLLCALQQYSDSAPLNIGSSVEVSIADLARLIAVVTGYQGEIRFNSDMPDGTPRKVLDSRIVHDLGWQPVIGLESGLRDALEAYRRYHVTF